MFIQLCVQETEESPQIKVEKQRDLLICHKNGGHINCQRQTLRKPSSLVACMSLSNCVCVRTESVCLKLAWLGLSTAQLD